MKRLDRDMSMGTVEKVLSRRSLIVVTSSDMGFIKELKVVFS